MGDHQNLACLSDDWPLSVSLESFGKPCVHLSTHPRSVLPADRHALKVRQDDVQVVIVEPESGRSLVKRSTSLTARERAC